MFLFTDVYIMCCVLICDTYCSCTDLLSTLVDFPVIDMAIYCDTCIVTHNLIAFVSVSSMSLRLTCLLVNHIGSKTQYRIVQRTHMDYTV